MRSLLVVCALCAPAIADPAGVTEHSRLEVAPPNHAFKQLAIDNPLGDIKIVGYDGSAIVIETTKHAPDDDALARLKVSLVPGTDGSVRITTTANPDKERPSVSRSAVRIDLVIRAPHDARIDASVSTGKLEVENMDAGGELDAASGSISVKNVSGELMTHTLSGPMTITQAFGSVDAATVSADVELDTIGGEKLVASANRGRIAGRRVRSRDVELTTVEGKIQLEAEAALRGHLVVSSLHGDVDVRLHRHGAVVVRAYGTKVDLGVPVKTAPDGWAATTIGGATTDPPAYVEMRSGNGYVRFAIVQ
jgi:hypothetical protein